MKATGFELVFGIDITVLSVAFMLVVAAVGLLRHPRYPARAMLPFFVFVGIVIIGILNNDPGDYQDLKARSFLLLTSTVAGALPLLLRDSRDLSGLLVAWFAAASVVASLVFIIGAADPSEGRAGIGELTLGPAYLAAAGLIAGAAGVGDKFIPRILAFPGMALCGVALVSIGSRGPIIGAALGLVIWILLRGALKGDSIAILLLVASVGILGVLTASEAALSRFVFEDTARSQLWTLAWTAFVQQPGFGLGWGDFTDVAQPHLYPHNLFLETASELGLVGLLGVVTLLLVALSRVWRTRSHPASRGLGAVAMVLLVGQQFSSDLTNKFFWIALVPCLLLPALVDPTDSDGHVARDHSQPVPANPSRAFAGQRRSRFRDSSLDERVVPTQKATAATGIAGRRR